MHFHRKNGTFHGGVCRALSRRELEKKHRQVVPQNPFVPNGPVTKTTPMRLSPKKENSENGECPTTIERTKKTPNTVLEALLLMEESEAPSCQLACQGKANHSQTHLISLCLSSPNFRLRSHLYFHFHTPHHANRSNGEMECIYHTLYIGMVG
eukprot:scaffold1058_cov163-Amphora_coffeaeformis.AAC.8